MYSGHSQTLIFQHSTFSHLCCLLSVHMQIDADPSHRPCTLLGLWGLYMRTNRWPFSSPIQIVMLMLMFANTVLIGCGTRALQWIWNISKTSVEYLLTPPCIHFVLALLHTLKEPVECIEIYWKRRINKVGFKCFIGRNCFVRYGLVLFLLQHNYEVLLHD